MSATPHRSQSSIATEQTYSGTQTFLRMTRAASAAGCDFAILGIPFDLATSNRPGCRFGPQSIRSVSAVLGDLKAYPGGFDPLQHVKAVDLGDVFLDAGNPHTIPDAIEAAAEAVVKDKAFLCALGGDHFVSYPLLRAHRKHMGPLALIHFDAHTDTWASSNGLDQPPELNHGTMFARAAAEGLVVPERSIQIGIRTWVDDPLSFNILDSEAAFERQPAEIARMIRAITNGLPCYLTVDIDCLDPAYAPGTGTPVTGGLEPIKLMQILRAIRDLPIVGCDVVEVAPPYDTDSITALNAATIVYEQLCRLAVAKGAKMQRYPVPVA